MKLDFYTYQLPFIHPFKTAKNTFNSRQGLFMHLRKKGINAWGEAAPLPGFSRETMPEVLRQVHQSKKDINEFFTADFSINDLQFFLSSQKLVPSLQFALFTVCTFYLAQKKQLKIEKLISSDVAGSLPLNAVLDLHHPQDILQRADELVKGGFKTLKIKVSDDPAFVPLFKNIRHNHPEIALRLDPNRSWSMQQAVPLLNELEPMNIEYCEEPLQKSDAASINELTQKTTIPIALDESLADTFSLKQALNIAPVLIIKPMVLGLNAVWNELQSKNNDQTILIFTTSLEAGIGRLMTATLAAGFGAANHAHGLATGSFLAQDAWTDKRFITNGFYQLPETDKLAGLMHIDPKPLNLQKI